MLGLVKVDLTNDSVETRLTQLQKPQGLFFRREIVN